MEHTLASCESTCCSCWKRNETKKHETKSSKSSKIVNAHPTHYKQHNREGREGGREGEGRGYLGVPGRSEGEGRSLEGSRGGDGSGEGRGGVEASRLVDGSDPLLHLHHISVGGRKGRDITKRICTCTCTCTCIYHLYRSGESSASPRGGDYYVTITSHIINSRAINRRTQTAAGSSASLTW